MLGKLWIGLVLGLVGLTPTLAQDSYPEFELFGGYSYTNTGLTSGRRNASGFGASFTANVDPHVGLTVDFATQYGSQRVPTLFNIVATGSIPCAPFALCATREDFHTRQLLFGPTLVERKGPVSLFSHTLFGISRFPSAFGTKSSNFAMGIGGGLDATVSDRFAIRFFQVDYVPTHTSERWAHDVRVQTGIVVRFGKK